MNIKKNCNITLFIPELTIIGTWLVVIDMDTRENKKVFLLFLTCPIVIIYQWYIIFQVDVLHPANNLKGIIFKLNQVLLDYFTTAYEFILML